jgi:hypothetical protein
MNYWYFLIIHIFFVSVIADILKLDVQQDERVRLECTLTSKEDTEEVNFLRIYSI